ncbi:MAG: hypothetical protein VB120_04525 [Lachnospiraceae bacterium]|nr:hypothetical protein [Lachnospiraceae bacterium]
MKPNQKWLKLKTKNAYLNTDIFAIFPDLNSFVPGSISSFEDFSEASVKKDFEGFSGELITYDEFFETLMPDYENKGLFYKALFKLDCFTLKNKKIYNWFSIKNKDEIYIFGCSQDFTTYNIPIFRLFGEAEERSLKKAVLKLEEKGFELE